MKRWVACLLLLAPGAALAKKAPSLPVMQIEARSGADPRLAALATDAVSESLRDLDVFKVISSDDIKKLLSFQRQKTLVGGQCTEDECLAEIGGALGADYMVSGKLSRIGKTLKLDLQLFNNARAKVDAAFSRDDLTGEKELVEAAKVLARQVVTPILDKNAGQLFVTVTDRGAAGASIDVDGKTTTITVPPGVQAAPITLGWGPHRLVVTKEGFLSFQKDVQIDEGQPTTVVVTLVPSPDFVDAYKSRNTKLRFGAYATGLLAVGLAGGALYLNYKNVDLYKHYSNAMFEQDPGTQTTRPYPGVGGCEALRGDTGSGSCAEALTQGSAQGKSQLLQIGVLGGAAVVSAATAVVLYTLSDDPGRYDTFLQAGLPASGTASTRKPSPLPEVGLSVLPGGVYSTLGLRF